MALDAKSPGSEVPKEALSLESKRMMIRTFEGMISGVGFASPGEGFGLVLGPSTLTLKTYLNDPWIAAGITSLYNTRDEHISIDPDGLTNIYKTSFVDDSSRVFTLCLKEIDGGEYLVQVEEVKYNEVDAIEVLSGVLNGVGFGVPFISEYAEGKSTSIVDFSNMSPSMKDFVADPNLREELALLTQDEKNIIQNPQTNSPVYAKQIVSELGHIYNIQAKRIGEKYLYTVNEVIQEIDPMTGLGSKHAYERELKEIEASMKRDKVAGRDSSVAVIFIDLDDFKIVNDKFGHVEGDKMIIEAGRVLKESLGRETDFIARLGGDEYVILLKDVSPEAIEVIKRKITHNLEKSNSAVSEEDRKIKFSFGVATNHDVAIDKYCQSTDNITPKIVEMMADQRMYETKKLKKVGKEIERLKEKGEYTEGAYVTVIEDIFNLKRDFAWRIRKDNLTGMVDLMFANDQFGSQTDPAARRKRALLLKAIFFQDLLAMSKSSIAADDGDKSLQAERWESNQKAYSEIKPVNEVHPQLAHDFVIGLRDFNIPDLSAADIDEIAAIVEYQHAWYDGTNSPKGADISEIPSLSHWLSIINAYVAMLTKGHGEKMNPEQAFQEIKKMENTQFNPQITDEFIRIVKDFNEKSVFALTKDEI